MEIIIIAGLILLNGVFAMSEIAIISARKSKLSSDIKKGDKNAKTALELAANPDSFLSTVQVGITLIGILTGIYSGDVLATDFSVFLIRIGIPPVYGYKIAQIVIVITVTYFSIIFGELIPKRIGLNFAEVIAKTIAKPMKILSGLVRPFVWLLSESTSSLLKLTGFKNADSIITEDEIKAMIQESREDGEIQSIEQDIVGRVFGLGDRTLDSVMTHRSEIAYIHINAEKENMVQVMNSHPFNKYPVIRKNLDNIEGVVYVKDIIGKINDKDFTVGDYLKPVVYFPETMKVYSVLEEMKHKKIDSAFVIDEYGSLQGLVSLMDIMEALVGEIPEPHDEPKIIRRQDGTYLVDGQMSFYDFLMYFDNDELFLEEDHNTLSGLILEILKSIPRTGDMINWKHFKFEIVDMDGPRIDKVLVTKISPDPPSIAAY